MSVLDPASKRMSLITEMKSKRDTSDTASLLTVDEITAEVDRRISMDTKESDWTAVDADVKSIKSLAEEEEEETSEEEYEEEEEEDEEEDLTEGVDSEEEGRPKAITSHGGMYCSLHIIGVGLINYVPQRELSNGSKALSSALVHSAKSILVWMLGLVS